MVGGEAEPRVSYRVPHSRDGVECLDDIVKRIRIKNKKNVQRIGENSVGGDVSQNTK